MYGGTATVRTIQALFEVQDRGSATLLAAEKRADGLSGSVERTEQRLDDVTQMMALTGTAAAGLAAGIVGLTSRFSRLDKQFATIATTSGATAEQMDKIRDAAKGVSTSLPVALSESTQAAKELSYAGLSASETMAALSETSQLAVAGNLQAGQAAQTVARSLNAFELEARQTDAVVGALGQTFSESASSVTALTKGLSEVQATANAAGLSVAETTASLGLLASSGLAGSRGGTALNSTLQQLTSGSGKTKEALDELGLSMRDFTNESGDLKNLPVIMQTLSAEMNNVESQAERLRIANELVGAEGSRALLPMTRNVSNLSNRIRNNLRAEIQGAVGDLAEMSDSELSTTGELLGMGDLSAQTTTAELVSNLQQLEEEGETTAQITARLESGLGLTSDAAQLLARDITETNRSAEELANEIGGVVSAEELAESQTRTLSGQIQQLRSDFQVLGYEMFQGTKPATTAVVGGLRSITTPLAQNETAARALGTGLVGLSGVLALATGGLAAHAAQLKLSTLAQSGHATQTLAGTAALKAHALAAGVASKAHWALTASSGALVLKTAAMVGTLHAEAAAHWGSVTATLSNATAMGVLTGATALASTALASFWSLLGPIGWAVLGLTAAGAALAGVMATDLWGAGDKAGAILGWFGDKAGVAWRATQELVGILWELGRIGGTIVGLSLLAPFAGVLKLPGFIRSVGPEAKEAAMQLPGQIIAGLDSMGPAKYALPILGPLLGATDFLTGSGQWRDAGAQIPVEIARGIGAAADAPVDAVAGMVGDARQYLPFSPAEVGPLSTLDNSGGALVSTIADGVESESGQLTSALEATLGRTPLGMATTTAIDVTRTLDASVPQQKPQKQRLGEKSATTEPTVNVTIEEINVDGSGEDVTGDVERAAQRGTTTAFEQFLRRISRETRN